VVSCYELPETPKAAELVTAVLLPVPSQTVIQWICIDGYELPDRSVLQESQCIRHEDWSTELRPCQRALLWARLVPANLLTCYPRPNCWKCISFWISVWLLLFYLVDVDCGEPELGIGTERMELTGTYYGDQATYLCPDGWGDATRHHSSITSDCLSSGQWSELRANCIRE